MAVKNEKEFFLQEWEVDPGTGLTAERVTLFAD